MPEVILVVFVIALVFSPQILAYKFAEYLGRDKKFWFWISFLIPVISLFILMFLPETEKKT
ncbi:hypothetical protein Pedsa_0211 [Pseudopedobacter saltans DSM 12145]|uniref:Uncharacterized protein n=1 Tax=Pseudopedobacter saltans (strain ATCC 51119 / DSM 12145 / JCM 21818 / CCUG 39354 / LMG 10337 / NBRC 100064 / NCIMB 13643) TaxID=762903 RepID=F0SED2_PSESL|nr:hypothetical protein [Pseudopedobacter saltans]ADY50797.1 hypothetical protein Pedsa_0211 [Pseudopedobacter saltans DSM 12145]